MVILHVFIFNAFNCVTSKEALESDITLWYFYNCMKKYYIIVLKVFTYESYGVVDCSEYLLFRYRYLLFRILYSIKILGSWPR